MRSSFPRRPLLPLVAAVLIALGLTPTLLLANSQAADVSPSGETYDPDALARSCLRNVRSEHTGTLGYLDGQRLSGATVVNVPVTVMPMESGLPGVNCPAPAWEHESVRLLFRNDQFKDVPVSAWQAAPDAAVTNPGAPYVPPLSVTLSLHLFPGQTYKPCYPLRRQGRRSPALNRTVFLQIRTRAHSGEHGVAFSRKHSFYPRDRCTRTARG